MVWRRFTDEQWKRIKPSMPPRPVGRKGGRPWVDDRRCLEGVLWIIWTGCPWSELPLRYGRKSTVHNRLKEWAQSRLFLSLWQVFLEQLDQRHRIHWEECFLDGTFAAAKKGATKSAKPSGERVPK